MCVEERVQIILSHLQNILPVLVISARLNMLLLVLSLSVGGVLLAMIEGIGILMTRMSAEQFRPSKYSVSQAPIQL